jgi:hypothetical protein
MAKLRLISIFVIDHEPLKGRKCYHIAFTPRDDEDTDWAGEAYIDAQEFQPIYVFTKMSRRLPFGVRTLLGTDFPGIGFRSSGFLPVWQRISHPRSLPFQLQQDNLTGKQGLRTHPRANQNCGRRSVVHHIK